MGLSYVSVRFIRVNSPKLAILHYVFQALILAYVIFVSIVWEQGYQEYDTLVGTVWIKPKGTGIDREGNIMDAYDVVTPALEANSIFLAHSVHTHLNQTRGTCPGNIASANLNDPDNEQCVTDADCVNKPDRFTDNGILLDQCIGGNETTGERGFCLIQAWCPPEPRFQNQSVIQNMANVTIRAVANVYFPRFNVSRSTSWPPANGPLPGPLYPEGLSFFRADQFMTEAGYTWDDLERGAIILVTVQYDCNLNKGEDACEPTIQFNRLDVDAPGFNYRYPIISVDENGEETRALRKVVGLRVLFQVNGRAGRFGIVPLLTALGAGMALLSFATVACDFLLEYVMPGKEEVANEKFAPVDVPDRYNRM